MTDEEPPKPIPMKREEFRQAKTHPDNDIYAVANVQNFVRCGRPSCRCSHQFCVGGWIDKILDDGTGRGHEVATPCPSCKSELHDHFRKGGSLEQWRAIASKLGEQYARAREP